MDSDHGIRLRSAGIHDQTQTNSKVNSNNCLGNNWSRRQMSVVTCPRCGASNTPTARFCSTCGTSLITIPAPTLPPMGYAPPPAAQQYYPYQYPANSWEVARTNKINNTLTGLLLLVIGV